MSLLSALPRTRVGVFAGCALALVGASVLVGGARPAHAAGWTPEGISAVAFVDLNNNSVRDADEPMLPGVVFDVTASVWAETPGQSGGGGNVTKPWGTLTTGTNGQAVAAFDDTDLHYVPAGATNTFPRGFDVSFIEVDGVLYRQPEMENFHVNVPQGFALGSKHADVMDHPARDVFDSADAWHPTLFDSDFPADGNIPVSQALFEATRATSDDDPLRIPFAWGPLANHNEEGVDVVYTCTTDAAVVFDCIDDGGTYIPARVNYIDPGPGAVHRLFAYSVLESFTQGLVPDAGVSIAAQFTNGSTVKAGEPFTVEYVVTNTKTAPLTSVVISDPLVTGVKCPSAALEPGKSMTCTATGTAAANQSQLQAKPVVNAEFRSGGIHILNVAAKNEAQIAVTAVPGVPTTPAPTASTAPAATAPAASPAPSALTHRAMKSGMAALPYTGASSESLGYLAMSAAGVLAGVTLLTVRRLRRRTR